jgi:hypothetical protein
MTSWTDDELNKIDAAEELEIAALREDGTSRKPVTIWVVRVEDGVYVRSAYGTSAAWYRATKVRDKGHVKIANLRKDVTFEAADPPVADRHSLSQQVSPPRRAIRQFGHNGRSTLNNNQTGAA